MVRSTLSEMSEKLPANLFIRINRGTIINLYHVSKVQTEKVILGDFEFSINKTIRENIVESMETTFR